MSSNRLDHNIWGQITVNPRGINGKYLRVNKFVWYIVAILERFKSPSAKGFHKTLQKSMKSEKY
jgi:hypothetical protein